MNRKKSLGRGLASILGKNKYNDKINDISKENHIIKSEETFQEIEINQIKTNPFQPRKEFNQEKLHELAISIEQFGIIQPITVRKMNENKYQLISGERRLRASQIAGIKKIPAYIRITNDQEMLEIALIENIQREDLNPIEIALSYKRLINEIKLTQEECSERIGKSRSTITNFLRLLNLPDLIQNGLKNDSISVGHAKALLSIKDSKSQINLFYDTVANGYSVRELEQMAKDFSNTTYKRISKNYQSIQAIPFIHQKNIHDLSKKLNTSIEFKRNKNGNGKIIIPFNNDEDLEKILKIINK